MDSETIEFAIKLHSHLSPGLALGIRMAEIAYKNLGIKIRGKGLVSIAETSLCVPDALQVVVGTTIGNRNLILKDYGKLALSIVRLDSMEGYRVSLKKDAVNKSELMRKFLLREGKLDKDAENKLAMEFLSLEEHFFDVRKIKLLISVEKRKEGIAECEKCGELQPISYTVEKGGKRICIACNGDRYFDEIK
ncbi:MAG: FmdE family protein [Archaeoglobaceae archaeon]|nr:FmdE family protein [Archaeoglobaceae archaeon]MDW8117644.1 FmdE family protein [Archaeoglobaceae archaeon]